jgi:APA family basic amino acid/polyamine antiporter
MSEKKEEAKLKREIDVYWGTLFTIGGILSTGIYVGITTLNLRLGDFMWAPLLFLVPVILMDALPYAEMGSRFPSAAAGFEYMREGFTGLFGDYRGTALAFIMNFFNTIMMTLISGGLTPSAFAGYAQAACQYTFGFMPSYDVLRFLAIIIAFSIGLIGIKGMVIIGDLMSFMEVAVCLGVGAIGFLMPTRSPNFFNIGGLAAGSSGGDLFMHFFFTVAVSYEIYSGYQMMAGPLAEEIVEPVKKNLPRVIIYSVLIASFIHLWVSTGAQFRVPPEQYATTNSIFALVVTGAFEGVPWVPMVVAWLTSLAVYNGIIFGYVGRPRTWYGMGREGMLPKFVGVINTKFRNIPLNAMLLMFVLQCSSFLIGQFREILYVLSTALIFNYGSLMLAFVGVRYKYRNQPRDPNTYYVPRWLNIGKWFCIIPPIMFVIFGFKFIAMSINPLAWPISLAALGVACLSWWIPGLIPAKADLKAGTWIPYSKRIAEAKSE